MFFFNLLLICIDDCTFSPDATSTASYSWQRPRFSSLKWKLMARAMKPRPGTCYLARPRLPTGALETVQPIYKIRGMWKKTHIERSSFGPPLTILRGIKPVYHSRANFIISISLSGQNLNFGKKIFQNFDPKRIDFN